jgi:hypothetical protein
MTKKINSCKQKLTKLCGNLRIIPIFNGIIIVILLLLLLLLAAAAVFI